MYLVGCTLGYLNHKGQLSHNNLYIQISFLIYVQNVLINYIYLWGSILYFYSPIKGPGEAYTLKKNFMIVTNTVVNEIHNTVHVLL